jgi:hypothetical protein
LSTTLVISLLTLILTASITKHTVSGWKEPLLLLPLPLYTALWGSAAFSAVLKIYLIKMWTTPIENYVLLKNLWNKQVYLDIFLGIILLSHPFRAYFPFKSKGF